MGLFFNKKEVYSPTLLGGIIIVGIFFLGSFILLKLTYPFLAQNTTPVSKILVVEGWLPDSGLKNAIDYYRSNSYEYMILTGVPITQWTHSSPFSNMADASKETMRRYYFRDTIYTATIPNTILRDRTYATAVALKMTFEEWDSKVGSFDLYSMGAHSRRSYLMFRKAFPAMKIGLIADTDLSFEPKSWYKTSRGFRIVFSELISYFYSRLFFYPAESEFRKSIIEGRYIDNIISSRFEKDRYFEDTLTSPLNKSEVEKFRGLDYFDVDTNYRFDATFVVDTSELSFKMPTTTDRQPVYRKYGTLSFTLNDTSYKLSAYQNLDLLLNKPDYRGLFIPFKDLSNGNLTYGGGRYLDIDIPQSDRITLDFNKVYNPYCAYDERWSCPLPPAENYLKTSILAGEKKYFH
jgi:uncharacterized protein